MIVKNPTDNDITVMLKGKTYTVKANDSLSGVPETQALYWKNQLHSFLTLLPEEEMTQEVKEEIDEVVKDVESEKVSEDVESEDEEEVKEEVVNEDTVETPKQGKKSTPLGTATTSTSLKDKIKKVITG